MNIFKLISTTIALFTIIQLSSCKNDKVSEQEITDQHTTVDPSSVAITQEQYNALDLELAPIEKRNLNNTIKANGILSLPPQNHALVSSYLGGKVNKILVIEGDHVKEGQVLAIIENPEFMQIQQDYIIAKSNYAFSEKDYLRQKELYEGKVISQKKFQQSETDFLSQKALVQSFEQRLNQLGIQASSVSKGNLVTGATIKAPISGYIHNIKVKLGSYLEQKQDMFEIVDNSHIHIDLNIFQADLTRIREGQRVYFTLTGHEDEELEANIFATGKAFDSATKSVTVHAEIRNNQKNYLLPGMYVDARIITDSVATKALPEDAIISEGDLHYIFVRKAHGTKKGEAHAVAGNHEAQYTFEKVLVKTGITDLGFTEVIPLEKLADSSKVVVHGAYYLSAEMKKAGSSDLEEGH